MQKIKDFCASKYFTLGLLALGMLVILYYYFSKVPQLFVVWELVDEYGYLANAAYLSGTDWAFVSNMYYAYGFSLWLIPLFWLCGSGVGIIRATVLFNALCVAALFLVQYILMSKLCRNTNKNVIAVLSFILCFYPFYVSSSLKVICEVLLALVSWVIGLLLYQALDTGKKYYYVLAAICTVYLFFVHTRAIVFCGVVVLAVGVMFLLKKIDWKQLMCFAVPALIIFILGFMLKNHIVDAVYSNELFELAGEAGGTDVQVGNMLSVSYVFEQILGVFTNFSVWHLYGFASRNFYLFVGTLGMFHIGAVVAVKDAVKELVSEKKLSSINAIKLLYAVGAILMVVATTVDSPGNPDAPAYSFYGRYYEYIIGPAVFMGVDYCVNNRMKLWGSAALLLGFGVTIWLTMEIGNLLNVHEMPFDSTRIVAFSMFAMKEYYFRAIVRLAAKFTLVAILVTLVLNYGKKLRILVPVVLMAVFLLNDNIVVNNILSLQANNKDEYEIATYVDTYYPDVEEVHFVNGDYVYVISYAGLQTLLGHEKLVLVEGSNAGILESGDIFVTFRNNAYLDLIEEPITKMWETRYYELYKVE